ncbi:MAG: hypothetical protein ACUVSQ_08870 [Pseudanabaenaceae cyanobacterium]
MTKPRLWETEQWLEGWLAVVLALSAVTTSHWGETVLNLPAVRALESPLLLLAVTVTVASIFYGFVWVYGIPSPSAKPTRSYRGIPPDPTALPKPTVKLRYGGAGIEGETATPPSEPHP